MGFPRQEYWSVALSFSRGSSQLRHRTWVSFISGLPTEPPGKPCWSYWQLSNFAYILQCIPIDTSKWSQLYPIWAFSSVQFITQSCLTLCNPMSCSTPGLPVHHQLLESTQTHVHWVGDAIQPSHPLSSPSPPALNLSQYQGLFKWVSSSHQVAKVLEFQLQNQSYQWTPRTDLLLEAHDILITHALFSSFLFK